MTYLVECVNLYLALTQQLKGNCTMQVKVISTDHELQLELVAETPAEKENLARLVTTEDSSIRQHLIYPHSLPIDSIKVKLEG